MMAGRQLLAGVPLLISCIGLYGQLDPLNDWQIIARPPMELRGLAHKDGTFVGVASGTNIVVSTDAGASWFLLPISLPGFGGALAVTEGAGRFVAVGLSGDILTSTDGLQWTRARDGLSEPAEEFWAVTYGGGRFVAVGFQFNHGTIAATSTDGIQWEKYALPFDTTPRNIAYGNGVYVAAGWRLSMYSRNGVDWTPFTNVLTNTVAVAYGGGQFIAATFPERPGYSSSNGVDWTEILLPQPAYGGTYYTAAYANGMFIFGGDCSGCPNTHHSSLLMTSTEGREWTFHVFGGTEYVGPIRDIAFANGSFYLADSTGGKIWKSGRMSPITRPEITRVSRSDGQTSLSFSTVRGFRYQVESKNRWDASPWQTRVGPLFAPGDQLTVSDSSPEEPLRFYRVRSE